MFSKLGVRALQLSVTTLFKPTLPTSTAEEAAVNETVQFVPAAQSFNVTLLDAAQAFARPAVMATEDDSVTPL